jgi:hypothetical protein
MRTVSLDINWKNALFLYSNIENGEYGKDLVSHFVSELLKD